MVARWIVVGMCCCGTAALAAQAPDAARAHGAPAPAAIPPRSSTPTFSSGVELVSLTVTVTDRHDRFLSGLTADDFTVRKLILLPDHASPTGDSSSRELRIRPEWSAAETLRRVETFLSTEE